MVIHVSSRRGVPHVTPHGRDFHNQGWRNQHQEKWALEARRGHGNYAARCVGNKAHLPPGLHLAYFAVLPQRNAVLRHRALIPTMKGSDNFPRRNRPKPASRNLSFQTAEGGLGKRNLSTSPNLLPTNNAIRCKNGMLKWDSQCRA